MKKLIILLAVVMAICAMSVSTLAAWDGFVESPSASGAPTIVESASDVGVKISAYRDRTDKLSPDQVANFESAYNSIVGFSSVADMNPDIPKIARDLNVNPSDLAISDLFYITIEERSGSESASVEDKAAFVNLAASTFKSSARSKSVKDGVAFVTLESATFNSFVCLVNYDGENWNIVEAEKGDNNVIEFYATPGAYGVVISTGAEPDRTEYRAPTIVESDSDAGVRVSAYKDRTENLAPGQIANFENAYKSMTGFASVSEMNSSISGIATDAKVDVSELAISDLYYITLDEGKGNAVVSLESDTFDKFVCLLRYDGTSWVVVEVEKTDDNVIKYNALPGAYAVVVSTDATPDHSGEDNNAIVAIIIIAAVVAAAAAASTAAFLLYKKKKPEVPVVAPTPPTFNRRKKGRKVKGNTQRNRNRQRKKKRDKNKNRKRKKHG